MERQSNKQIKIWIDGVWTLEDFTMEDVKAGQTFKLDGQEYVALGDGYIDKGVPTIDCRAPYPQFDDDTLDGFQPTPTDQICTKCREVADCLHDETDCERCDQPWWFRTSPEFMESRIAAPTSDESWDTVFLSVARSIANLSKCASRQFGAVIVKDRRILSTGFNGAPTRTTLCQKPEATCPRQLLGMKKVDPLHDQETKVISLIGTGRGCFNDGKYISTVQMEDSVWHIFEVV